MASVSTTATTATAQIYAPANVHYTFTEPTGETFQVIPHEPTPR